MDTKIIATGGPIRYVHRYTKEYCIDQINQWIEVYNHLDSLSENTNNIAYKLHWTKTKDYVGWVLSFWINRCNEIDK